MFLEGADVLPETAARIGQPAQISRNSLLISLLAGKLASETSAIRTGSSASHRGLSAGISRAHGSADISGGWRPRARSPAGKFRGLAPKAAKFGAGLGTVIFQDPKSGSGAVKRPVAFQQRPVRNRTPNPRSGTADPPSNSPRHGMRSPTISVRWRAVDHRGTNSSAGRIATLISRVQGHEHWKPASIKNCW